MSWACSAGWGTPGGAAQNGTHSRHQLTEVNRPAQAIIGAGHESRQAMGDALATGDHDDRHMGGGRVSAELLAQIQSVHIGQLRVNHDEVGNLPHGQAHGLSGRHGHQDLELLFYQGPTDRIQPGKMCGDD
jgi:hypothetical protein